MRYSVALLTMVLSLGCNAPDARGQSQVTQRPAQTAVSQGQTPSTKPPLEFLIDSAASDFHAQRQPHPARFRHVRAAHVRAADGSKQYLLCGEFVPAQEKGKAKWVPFITIKTSGYEQYVGDQAADLCRRSTVVWENQGDLSSALQSRFDALR